MVLNARSPGKRGFPFCTLFEKTYCGGNAEHVQLGSKTKRVNNPRRTIMEPKEIHYNSCNLEEAVGFVLGAMMAAYTTETQIQVGLEYCRFSKESFDNLLTDEWRVHFGEDSPLPVPKTYPVEDNVLLIVMK
jgi:hypothetical protein